MVNTFVSYRFYQVQTESEYTGHTTFKESCFRTRVRALSCYSAFRITACPENLNTTRRRAFQKIHIVVSRSLPQACCQLPREKEVKDDFPLTGNLRLITLGHGITKTISAV